MNCTFCSSGINVQLLKDAELRNELKAGFVIAWVLRMGDNGHNPNGTNSGAEDALARFGVSNDEFAVCMTCSNVLREVTRLDRVIEELKKSQQTFISMLSTLVLQDPTQKKEKAQKQKKTGPCPLTRKRKYLGLEETGNLERTSGEKNLRPCFVRLERIDGLKHSSEHISVSNVIKKELSSQECDDGNSDHGDDYRTDEEQVTEEKIGHVQSRTGSYLRRTRSYGGKRKLSQIVYLRENMYLIDYCVIKFDTESRMYTCLEGGCRETFTGNHLDGSIFQTLRNHVTCCHPNPAIREDKKCPACETVFAGGTNIKEYRSHHLNQHSNFYPDKKRAIIVICEECGGRPLRNTYYRYHVWTHKNYEDKIAAVNADELVPSKMRISLRQPRQLAGLKTVDNNRRLIYKLNETTFLYKFTTISALENGSKLICNEPGCSLTFSTASNSPWDVYGQVQEHIDSVHEKFYHVAWARDDSSERICPLCQSSFLRGDLFRHHIFDSHLVQIQMETQKRAEVICEVCGDAISHSSTNYKYHRQSHMNPSEIFEVKPADRKKDGVMSIIRPDPKNPESFSCTKCDRVFRWAKNLKAHMIRHVNSVDRKMWECPICSTKLLSAVAVRHHIARIHNTGKNRPKTCPEEGCRRVFHYFEHYKFKQHLLTHKKEESWVCASCGKVYFSQLQLKTHTDNFHKGDLKATCDQCGKVFGRRYIKAHKAKMHENTND